MKSLPRGGFAQKPLTQRIKSIKDIRDTAQAPVGFTGSPKEKAPAAVPPTPNAASAPKFEVELSKDARGQLAELESNPTVFKAVNVALDKMRENLRQPGLNSKVIEALQGPSGEKVFQVYAQNNTPRAYRIFWYYGAGKKIVIMAIAPHPSW